MLSEILLLFIAGLGAGIVTGMFGGSATLVVVPILVIFAGYHPYIAIGLALSIDVFSSFAAYLIYKIKNKFSIKPALPMIIAALSGVLLGSFLSISIPEKPLAILAGIGILIAGFRFIFVSGNNLKFLNKKFGERRWVPVVWGFVNGIGLGIVGGGGGVVLLIGLTMLLKYPIHKAVGVSVIGMVAIAFFGAVGHYILMPFPIWSLIIGVCGGVIGAVFSAKFANRLSEKRLNISIGLILFILGVSLFFKGVFFI